MAGQEVRLESQTEEAGKEGRVRRHQQLPRKKDMLEDSKATSHVTIHRLVEIGYSKCKS